jgi:cell division septal protein FtsQ
MATDKRQRQRANRAEKQAAEAKQKRRAATFALIKKYGGYALLVVVALILFTLLTSN